MRPSSSTYHAVSWTSPTRTSLAQNRIRISNSARCLSTVSFDEDRRRSAGKISISSGLDRLDTSGDRVGSMLQSAAPINQVSEDKGPVDVNGVRYGGGDVDILRHWRHRSIVLQRMWSKDGDPTRDWRGVTFEQSRADAFIRDRVTDIELDDTGLTGVIRSSWRT